MRKIQKEATATTTNTPFFLNRNGLTYHRNNETLFVPMKWIIFISLLLCSILSFLFVSAIRIESDDKIETVFIKDTDELATTIKNSSGVQTITLYEYVIGNDTMFMNEDQNERFQRIILKEIENEKQQVQNIKIELKQKFNIVRSDDFLLSEIRHETRKKLFFEIPAELVEQNFPLFKVETKTVKITKPFVLKKPVSIDTNNTAKDEKLDFGNYTEAQAKEYILKYKQFAEEQQKRYGIPIYVTLGQALHESNAGKSLLARNANNHFGIKCFSHNCQKGHCQNYTDDSHKDFFRTFPNVWQSYEEHSKFLQKTRYKHLLELQKTDYKGWCKGLQTAGYATDKDYSQKLINTIEKYNLTKI